MLPVISPEGVLECNKVEVKDAPQEVASTETWSMDDLFKAATIEHDKASTKHKL